MANRFDKYANLPQAGVNFQSVGTDHFYQADNANMRFLTAEKWTYFCFVNFDSSADFRSIGGKWGNSASLKQFTTGLDRVDDDLVVAMNGLYKIQSGGIYPLGFSRWMSWVITNDGTGAAGGLKSKVQYFGGEIYQPQTGTAEDAVAATQSFNIGTDRQGSGTDEHAGDIAHVGYIKDELSDAEAYSMWTDLPDILQAHEGSIEAYWPFSIATSPTGKIAGGQLDVSGHGNNLTHGFGAASNAIFEPVNPLPKIGRPISYFSFASVSAETITADKWYQRASEPTIIQPKVTPY